MNGFSAPGPSPSTIQMVLDNVPAQIAYYDSATIRCLFSNEAYARANGKSAAQVVGLHCREIIGEAAWTLIGPHVEAVVAGQAAHYERALTLPSGQVRHVEVSLLPHLLDSGQQVGAFVMIQDITRRHEAELRRRESEDRLAKFVSASDEGILFHRQGVVEDCNEALAALLGRSREALIGSSVYAYVPEAEHDKVRASIHAGLRPTEYGLHVVHASGRLIPVAVRSRAMADQDTGQRIVVIRDVSERRDLLESLARSREQYQALVENSYEAVIVTQDGTVRFANATAERVYKRPRAALVGSPSIDLVHPEDRELVMGKRLALLGNARLDPYECRMVAGGGAAPLETIHAQVYAVKIEWEGRPALMVLVADISEQHRLRESLRHAFEQREAVLATTAVGVSMLRERRHEWVNATLCRMLGYEAHELIGQLTRLHYLSDEVYESFGQEVYDSLARTGRHTGEVQLRRRDGSLFWAQIDGHALDAANPRSRAVCTYMDITQRKIAEAEIRQALEREKELGVLKTRLVSMASHEFRTPLATIQTNTELIAHYHERLAPHERQACLDQIQQGVDRMRQLMEDFLTLDRIGDSRRRLASAPCDLAELLSVFAAETRSADRHRHAIELLPPEQPLPPVMLDKALVQQIVSNLLSNACKYSPPGRPVTLAWARQGEWIDIDVRDHGIGVPPQDLPRLFGTFMRASNVGDVPGTGLGLVIVRQAAESHGGSVGVTSRVGEGTSFHVHLPCVLAS